MKNFKEEVENFSKSVDFKANNYQVCLETNHGNITIDLFADRAPKHCLNFISLVKSGFYDNLTFHRIISGFVIQAGCPDGNGMGGPGYMIDAEFNDYPHDLGVLSMARAQDPNSAGSQFFICLGRVTHLDGNYTAFGKVADEAGLEVVKKIGASRTGAGDEQLEKVFIKKGLLIETKKN